MGDRAGWMHPNPILPAGWRGPFREPQDCLPSRCSLLPRAGWDTALRKPGKTPRPRENPRCALPICKGHSRPAAPQQPGLVSPAGWSRRPAHPTRCPGAGPRAQGTQWGHSLQPITGAASPCQHLPLLQVNTEQGHLSSAAARPGQLELHGAPGPCSPCVAVTSMGPSPQGDPRWRGRGWHRLSPLPAALPPPLAAQTPAPLPPSCAAGCRQKGSVGRVPDPRGHAGVLPNIHHPRQGPPWTPVWGGGPTHQASSSSSASSTFLIS